MSDLVVGENGLTLEDAVARAQVSPGPDTIRFASSVSIVELDDIVVLSGELTINGDHDNDGISDVVLVAARDHRHLTIAEGATVTLQNLDFGAAEVGEPVSPPRTPASSGANFTASATLDEPASPLDGGDAANDAANGEAGGNGLDGRDAVGSILNSGTLNLTRVGFANNEAHAEDGQAGGNGGTGGTSNGGDGLTDNRAGVRGESPSRDPNPSFSPFLRTYMRAAKAGMAAALETAATAEMAETEAERQRRSGTKDN